MRSFLVVVDKMFVEAQIMSNAYIRDYYNAKVIKHYSKLHDEGEEGEFVLGVYRAFDAQEAIKKASDDCCIDNRALCSYELKA